MAKPEDILQLGIEEAREGRKEDARQLFRLLTRQHPEHVQGWLWRAGVAENREERLDALDRVIELEPDNEMALKELRRLGAARPAAQTARSSDDDPFADDPFADETPVASLEQVSEGQGVRLIACPKCGTVNHASVIFCSKCAAPLPEPQQGPGLISSQRVIQGQLGQYEVLSLILQGTLSHTYKVRRSGENATFFLRELRPAEEQTPEEQREIEQRFRQGAELMRTLRSPHVPAFIELFEYEGRPVLVTEFVPGQNLESHLQHVNAPLTEQQALGYGIQLCRALQYLHSQQPPIIYCELKPVNVLLSPDGLLKLSDFGFVLSTKQHSKNKGRVNFGPYAYLAPEQYSKDQVDARSDIYALGANLFFLLTNHAPRLLLTPAPGETRTFNSSVKAETEAVIIKAMEQDPERRFASAAELEQALHACLDKPYVEPYASAPTAPAPQQLSDAEALLSGLLSQIDLPDEPPTGPLQEPPATTASRIRMPVGATDWLRSIGQEPDMDEVLDQAGPEPDAAAESPPPPARAEPTPMTSTGLPPPAAGPAPDAEPAASPHPAGAVIHNLSVSLSAPAQALAAAFRPPEHRLRIEVSQTTATVVYEGDGRRQVFSGPNRLDPHALGALLLDPDDYGRKLFSGIIHDTPSPAAAATSCTSAGYAHAQSCSGGAMQVRVALDPNTPYLHQLRWEYLLPAGDEAFLALRERSPLLRCLMSGAEPARPPAEPLRILAAIAGPANLGQPGNRYLERLTPVDIAAERAILTAEQALPRLAAAGVAEYTVMDRLSGAPVTLAALREAVEAGYSALHLVCHGLFIDEDYHLALERADGGADLVPAARLVQALAGHRLRLAVLVACQSAIGRVGDVLQGLGPKLVRAGVPAVIAMQDLLPIVTAQLFTQHFYNDLARSGRADMALAATRLALSQAGASPEWAIPALFSGSEESQLFQVNHERASAMAPLRPLVKSRSDLEGVGSVARRVAAAMAAEARRHGLDAVSPQAFHGAIAPLLAGSPGGAAEQPPPQDRAAVSARIRAGVRIDPDGLRQAVQDDPRGPRLRLPEPVYRQVAMALNAGKHLILIGPPGTAKTTLAEAICRHAAQAAMSAGMLSVTATADWTTFDTVGGYMPAAQGQLVFRPGRLLEALADGRWLIIDEINRADVDKAFGELFTVLSGQGVDLPYNVGGHTVRIVPPRPEPTPDQWWPEGARGAYDYVRHPNWRLIGTMNVYDKSSLFALSFAFMRRFAFVDIDLPAEPAYQDLVARWLGEAGLGERQPLGERLGWLIGPQQNALMRRRALGPAIVRDLVRYLAQCAPPPQAPAADLLDLFAEALLLYVAPQLDGLDQEGVREVYGFLVALLDPAAEAPPAPAPLADPAAAARLTFAGRQLLARVRQLYMHLPHEFWGG